MDCSPQGCSVLAILQARILEWVAIPFSRGIFLTHVLNLCLLHRQEDSLLSESPKKSHLWVQLGIEKTGWPSQSGLKGGESHPHGESCLENPMDEGPSRLWSVGSLSRT